MENTAHNAEPIDYNNKQETGIDKFLGLYNLNHVEVAENLKSQIREGHINPIQAYIALRRIEAMTKLTISSEGGDKEMKEFFKEEVAKALDGGKSVDMFGANLSIRPTGTSYDYSECGDDYLNKLYRIEKEIKEAIKQRETEIKTMLPPDTNKLGIQSRTVVQEVMPSFEWVESGHDNTITAPIKRQGSSIFCTFKKQK